MKAGDTFLIPDGISTHLNVVLAVLSDGSLVICHFTTLRKHSDATRVLQPGDHPFVNRPTAVRYDQTHVCPAERIENLKSVITKYMQPLSEHILVWLRDGALQSPQTPDRIKELLRKN